MNRNYQDRERYRSDWAAFRGCKSAKVITRMWSGTVCIADSFDTASKRMKEFLELVAHVTSQDDEGLVMGVMLIVDCHTQTIVESHVVTGNA